MNWGEFVLVFWVMGEQESANHSTFRKRGTLRDLRKSLPNLSSEMVAGVSGQDTADNEIGTAEGCNKDCVITLDGPKVSYCIDV